MPRNITRILSPENGNRAKIISWEMEWAELI